MTTGPLDEVERLFAAALALPAERRMSFLDGTAPNPAVRRDVLALLEAHQDPGPLDRIADGLRGLGAPEESLPLADLRDRLRAGLGGRYRVERELGRGGMAIVLLADDLKHGRQVALKVLQPTLALSIGSARFLREITIAARLTHPHIVPLHDSGEAGGLLYYVMPYVPGESVRDRLRREGRLPPPAARQIAREVADALHYAHLHDVVHRDIKPENILLQAGHALVTDFGIARAMTVAGGHELSEAGVILGTPAYMSPEQAAAGGTVDGRTDIYSLGCVLYEMVAGAPPFTGVTTQQVLQRHARRSRPRCRARRRSGR